MPFEQHNKLGGRKQGSLNTATQQTRVAFKCLLENNLESIQKDLDSLKPKERLDVLLKLATFVVPQLKAIEQDTTIISSETFHPVQINFIKNDTE